MVSGSSPTNVWLCAAPLDVRRDHVVMLYVRRSGGGHLAQLVAPSFLWVGFFQLRMPVLTPDCTHADRFFDIQPVASKHFRILQSFCSAHASAGRSCRAVAIDHMSCWCCVRKSHLCTTSWPLVAKNCRKVIVEQPVNSRAVTDRPSSRPFTVSICPAHHGLVLA